MSTPFTLRIESGPRAGQRLPLAGPVLTLGRLPFNGLVLADDPEVSRHHLRLTRDGGGLLVTDLGSTNGTRVNGARITGPHRLVPGDLLEVGRTRLRLEGNAPGGEAARAGIPRRPWPGRPARWQIATVPAPEDAPADPH